MIKRYFGCGVKQSDKIINFIFVASGKEVILVGEKIRDPILAAQNFVNLLKKEDMALLWIVSKQKFYIFVKGEWVEINKDILGNQIISKQGTANFTNQDKIKKALKTLYQAEHIPSNFKNN